MASADDRLGAAPDPLVISTGVVERRYVLRHGWYALHGAREGTPERTLGPGVSAYRGDPPESASARVGPVYEGDGGAIAVPTGRFFVEFAEGTRAGERKGEIEAAGFVIERVPGYAPHAAWVRKRSGDIASALADIRLLAERPGVAVVEPEMLMERAHKVPR